MLELQQRINEVYPPILPSLPEDRWQSQPEFPIQVMDPITYKLIQVDDLFGVINHTKTTSGELTLLRSLRSPLIDASLITAKQASIKELREDRTVRQAVKKFVEEAKAGENECYDYSRGNYSADWPSLQTSLYKAFNGSRRILQHLGGGLRGVEPQTDYLKAVVKNFSDLTQDKVFPWITDSICRTPWGLRPLTEVGLKYPEPFIEFTPKDLKFSRTLMILGPFAPGIGLAFFGAPDIARLGPLIEMLGLPFSMSANVVGRTIDDRLYIRPLHDVYFKNSKVIAAIDALGMIDELASLAEYADLLKVPITLPKVGDAPAHYFEATGLRNPVLAVKKPDYVPNNIDLNCARLTFVTGPNSGGKTSLAKTILQTQILAQIGSYIPAERASMAVADGIYYHSPMVNSLQDDEGRFGVEIARTRDIFFKTTPKSLVVLDELIEATTYEEKIRHSRDIMDGFWVIGGNTILVTHNHELAANFQSEGKGQFLQVEFAGQIPTHRVIPGISEDSHANLVLERLGFSREDILKHLRKSGYCNGQVNKQESAN